MGNAESGKMGSEEFIGQVNSMAAKMSEEGSIPITSLKPLVEVLKSIGQSIRHVEDKCSRLEREVAGLREQQLVIGARVAGQGIANQDDLETNSSPNAGGENPANNTEKSEKKARTQEHKENAHEAAEAEKIGEGDTTEKAEAQDKKSKKKQRRGRQRSQNATPKTETDNRSKTQFEEKEKPEDIDKLFLPKSASGKKLFEAANTGKVGELRRLLDAGVNPNLTARCGTALHGAAAEGHLACTSLLLERGANPDIAELLGRSPLHRASMNGQIDCMKELIKHGASLLVREISGQVPLHYAAIGGFEEAVKEILKHGVEVDVHDFCGNTPLCSAVMYRKPGAAKVLLEAGARRTDLNGRPLADVIQSSSEVIQLLRSYKPCYAKSLKKFTFMFLIPLLLTLFILWIY